MRFATAPSNDAATPRAGLQLSKRSSVAIDETRTRTPALDGASAIAVSSLSMTEAVINAWALLRCLFAERS
jgi:hypothetical protein